MVCPVLFVPAFVNRHAAFLGAFLYGQVMLFHGFTELVIEMLELEMGAVIPIVKLIFFPLNDKVSIFRTAERKGAQTHRAGAGQKIDIAVGQMLGAQFPAGFANDQNFRVRRGIGSLGHLIGTQGDRTDCSLA
jgi:hypothetical protein